VGGKERLRQVFWQFARPVKKSLVRAIRRPGAAKSDWGGLRSLTPISRDFGFDRGTPIDRYYIERFLASHGNDIHGHVMEVGTSMYTDRYGGDRVSRSDVLHHADGNPRATMVLDLSKAGYAPDRLFDCVICTQTLQYIFDVRTAVTTLYRMLKPGGVLLMTGHGISQICRPDMQATGDFWRFTDASIRRLLTEVFPDSRCEVNTYGNVVSSVGLLHGMAAEELTTEELDARDADFQLLLTARAVKPA